MHIEHPVLSRPHPSRLSRWCLPALVVASASWAGAAWAGPSQVPLKGSVETEEVLGFDLDRCPVTGFVGTTKGSGHVSHLGAVTLLASDCPLLPYGVPAFSNGTLVLTAANGDELKANYQGALMPVGGSSTQFSITGTFAVSGGTGRFVRATGGGALGGHITLGLQVSPGRYLIDGWISY